MKSGRLFSNQNLTTVGVAGLEKLGMSSAIITVQRIIFETLCFCRSGGGGQGWDDE